MVEPDDATPAARRSFGLALSGGGSRAAAFHAGTLRALDEVGIVSSVAVVSTVSGGSIFGAAWMASIVDGEATVAFLQRIRAELARGFIARSITWRVARLFVPGYTRSDLLAETFDRIFFHGRRLGDLPDRPKLCINTTVLNHGQVGKFAKDGFSTADLGPPRSDAGSNVPIALPGFSLARAATASAAFPIGLPPILVRRKDLGFPACRGNLLNDDPLALADGGVLENLGVQTLLKSRRFGAWDLILSDAGLKDEAWRPHSFGRWLLAFLIAMLSASVLRRVLELMSDKESRSMRSLTVAEVERSWLFERLRSGGEAFAEPPRPTRTLMFVRLNQTWDSLLSNIPPWRLGELAGENRSKSERPASLADVGRLLGDATKATFESARAMYDAMGGDARVAELNRIGTGFTALSSHDLDGLDQHARWQVHVLHAIYITA